MTGIIEQPTSIHTPVDDTNGVRLEWVDHERNIQGMFQSESMYKGLKVLVAWLPGVGDGYAAWWVWKDGKSLMHAKLGWAVSLDVIKDDVVNRLNDCLVVADAIRSDG
jgi:hypothetical protein